MRISGVSSGIGQETHWRNYFVDCPTVKVDGKEFTDRVAMADDEAMFVEVFVIGKDGKFVIENDYAKVEVIFGNVEIIGTRK